METIVKNIFQCIFIIGAAYSVGLVILLLLGRFAPSTEDDNIISLNDDWREAA